MGEGESRKQRVSVPVSSPPWLPNLRKSSNSEPGHGPVVMNLMCLQTSVMQELYASFEDGARPVGEFFTALMALKCTWPTGGKLMIQVKSGKPEQTRTWFSHQLVRTFLSLSVHSVSGLLITFVVRCRSKVNHWTYPLWYTQGVSRCSLCNLLTYRTTCSFYSSRNQRLSLLLLRRKHGEPGMGVARSSRWMSI